MVSVRPHNHFRYKKERTHPQWVGYLTYPVVEHRYFFSTVYYVARSDGKSWDSYNQAAAFN